MSVANFAFWNTLANRATSWLSRKMLEFLKLDRIAHNWNVDRLWQFLNASRPFLNLKTVLKTHRYDHERFMIVARKIMLNILKLKKQQLSFVVEMWPFSTIHFPKRHCILAWTFSTICVTFLRLERCHEKSRNGVRNVGRCETFKTLAKSRSRYGHGTFTLTLQKAKETL